MLEWERDCDVVRAIEWDSNKEALERDSLALVLVIYKLEWVGICVLSLWIVEGKIKREQKMNGMKRRWTTNGKSSYKTFLCENKNLTHYFNVRYLPLSHTLC